jgi:hypothetical protein
LIESTGAAAPKLQPGRFRLRPEVCRGADLRPEYGPLRPEEFVRFARAQGWQVEVSASRPELLLLELRSAPNAQPVRLRVAMLADAAAAGRELHEAVLQHGQGTWGVRRSNLAVLGPAASLQEIVRFAAHARLACWGVLTVAGRQEAFVIPGGYAEL